jgi:hypothetical protein
MAETTKFQANFKLADGTLVNIYADNAADFESQLTVLQDTTALIHSVSQSLGSAGPNPTFQRRSNYSKPAVTSSPEIADAAAARPAPVVVEGQTPQCKHGNMVFREGVSARGPWKGWMCSAVKGATDKCDPIFIR